MPSREILRFCLEKGLLLDADVLKLFSEAGDVNAVKTIIEKIKTQTQKRIITKSLLSDRENLEKVFLTLPKESHEVIDNIKIKLGLSIEISREIKDRQDIQKSPEKAVENSDVKVISMNYSPSKKLEVVDFVNYFRSRYSDLKDILQEHPDLDKLTSINKIPLNQQRFSLIGIVSGKRITKNKNIIFDIEDLTGKVSVLITKNKPELYAKAEEVTLDSVIGFKCSGSKEIIFVNDVVFPDAHILKRKNSNTDECVLFIGDLHIGSSRFFEEKFLKFVDYLNGNVNGTEEEVSKIKYLIIVGDLIAGVGAYPGQEYEIVLGDLESQFEKAAELLGKIRKDIKIIISPGNHDGIRLMEPQPVLDEKYAWRIYELENVILVGNPCQINISSNEIFDGFNVLLYHGVSYFYYTNNIPQLITKHATHNPELIMSYLLKNRHLAPTHSSTQYFPSEKDAHLIKTVPDIFVSGHIHKSAVAYHNNILMISVSSWEDKTPYMEKQGAEPDFCKVPMFNLKTRAIKILDFE
ncbi:MAG: metallophosphoesterase [archaeon]